MDPRKDVKGSYPRAVGQPPWWYFPRAYDLFAVTFSRSDEEDGGGRGVSSKPWK